MAADKLDSSAPLNLSRRSASLAALMGPLLVAEVLAGCPLRRRPWRTTRPLRQEQPNQPIRKVGEGRLVILFFPDYAN